MFEFGHYTIELAENRGISIAMVIVVLYPPFHMCTVKQFESGYKTGSRTLSLVTFT